MKKISASLNQKSVVVCAVLSYSSRSPRCKGGGFSLQRCQIFSWISVSAFFRTADVYSSRVGGCMSSLLCLLYLTIVSVNVQWIVVNPVLEIGFGPPSADLGPFGPLKKCVNFEMFKKHQKCVLCILSLNNLTKINYCCPTVLNSINKAEIGPLSFTCF